MRQSRAISEQLVADGGTYPVLPVHAHPHTREQVNARNRPYPPLSPYALATARAAALYVPGHPTEAWRIACREAQEAWDAQRGGAGDGAAGGASGARRLGVGKGSKR